MTENKIKEGNVECVAMDMGDTDAYFYANKAAKELGSADECGLRLFSAAKVETGVEFGSPTQTAFGATPSIVAAWTRTCKTN